MNKTQSWDSRGGQSSGRDNMFTLITILHLSSKDTAINSKWKMSMFAPRRVFELDLQVQKGF